MQKVQGSICGTPGSRAPSRKYHFFVPQLGDYRKSLAVETEREISAIHPATRVEKRHLEGASHMSSRIFAKTSLVAAAAALGLSVAAHASDDEGSTPAPRAPSAYQQICIDEWGDAPASDVCTHTRMTRVGASTAGDRGNCDISGISCSVSATAADGESVSWSWNGSSNRSPANTEKLDVCFAADTAGTAGYTAHFGAGCRTGEITSATMDGSTLGS